MAKKKKPKAKFSKLGYGVLALYALGLLVTAGAAYGISLTSILMKFNQSARIREEMKTGRVVVTTDRVECRSYRFDNVTSQVGAETVEECDERAGTDARPSTGAFGIISEGFNKR